MWKNNKSLLNRKTRNYISNDPQFIIQTFIMKQFELYKESLLTTHKNPDIARNTSKTAKVWVKLDIRVITPSNSMVSNIMLFLPKASANTPHTRELSTPPVVFHHNIVKYSIIFYQSTFSILTDKKSHVDETLVLGGQMQVALGCWQDVSVHRILEANWHEHCTAQQHHLVLKLSISYI